MLLSLMYTFYKPSVWTVTSHLFGHLFWPEHVCWFMPANLKRFYKAVKKKFHHSCIGFSGFMQHAKNILAVYCAIENYSHIEFNFVKKKLMHRWKDYLKVNVF